MATRHTVVQGECLASIARRYGLGSAQAIYDHPENADFRAQRPNPNVLHPGDCVFIPDPRPVSFRVPTGRKHVFQVRRPTVPVRVQLQNRWGRPFGNRPYRLEVGSEVFEGTTDEEGWVEHQVPANAESAALEVSLGCNDDEAGRYRWQLRLGSLDPSDESSGAQGRLLNLGYTPDSPEAGANGQTAEAIRFFQMRNKLPVTGRLDDATRQRMLERHQNT